MTHKHAASYEYDDEAKVLRIKFAEAQTPEYIEAEAKRILDKVFEDCQKWGSD